MVDKNMDAFINVLLMPVSPLWNTARHKPRPYSTSDVTRKGSEREGRARCVCVREREREREGSRYKQGEKW